MSNGGSWTPAPRGGLIPLHPLGFGTILGKSFAALRSNPKVLLGFAIGIQFLASVVLIVATAGVALWAYSRLDTVPYMSDDYQTIEAGSVLIVNVVSFVLGLAFSALALLIQAVVVGEVSYSALGEKATFGRIWGRVKGRIWALIGYALLLGAIIVGVALVVALIIGLLVFLLGGAGLIIMSVLLFVAVPGFLLLFAWLYTKLYVVAPAIVLERARVFAAMKRSWTLTKGRFWPTFGIYVLISLILGTAASIIVMPLSLVGTLIGSIFAPTGGEEQFIIIMIVTVGVAAIAAFLIQCVAIVVQSTSAVLVYIDLRMRREGIDLKMQRYIEARDSGAHDLPDPYRYDPSDIAPHRPAFAGYAAPAMAGTGGQPGYYGPQAPAPQGGYGPPPQQQQQGSAAPGAYSAPGAPSWPAPYGQQPPVAPPAPYAPPGGYPGQAPPVPPHPADPARPGDAAAPAPQHGSADGPQPPKPYTPPAGGPPAQ